MVLSHRRHRVRTPTRRRPTYRSDSYESVGPLGERIRGSASAIAEKYRQLARDAGNSDFTLSQNYYQHAEHFTRMSSGFDESNRYGGQNRRNTNGEVRRPVGSNDPHNIPQPDITGNGSSSMESGVDDESLDMQSILPPTIHSTESRYPKTRNPYPRRRRRFQTSDSNGNES